MLEQTYVHEVLHLLALHTALQLALLSGVQPIAQCGQLTAISVVAPNAPLAGQANDHETGVPGEMRCSRVTYMSIPLILGLGDCG